MAFYSEAAFDLAPAIGAVGTLAPAPVVMPIPKGDKLAIPDTLKPASTIAEIRIQPRPFYKCRGRKASLTDAIRKPLGDLK